MADQIIAVLRDGEYGAEACLDREDGRLYISDGPEAHVALGPAETLRLLEFLKREVKPHD